MLSTSNNKIYLNMSSVLPVYVTEYPFIRTKFRVPIIIEDISKEKIKIYYRNPIGGQPKPLILNKLIGFDKKILIGLGIYFGDGCKSELEITNADPKIIKYSMNLLEKIGFDKRDLKFQLMLHKTYKNIISEEEAIKFWKYKGIPFINSVHWHKKGSNKPLDKLNNKPAKYGYLAIRYYSRLGGLILYFLLKRLLFEVDKSKQYLIEFLKGAFAAEGSVLLQSNGSLMSVRYTTNYSEKVIIRSLLNKIGIQTSDYGEDIGICNLSNFLKLKNLEILKIKTANWLKFINALNKTLSRAKINAGQRNISDKLKYHHK